MHGENERASGWHEHDWRLIREVPQDPALHMALDEVLARQVAAGRRPPTLWMWEWSAPTVVIGSFQPLRNEVDAAEARRLGMTPPASSRVTVAPLPIRIVPVPLACSKVRVVTMEYSRLGLAAFLQPFERRSARNIFRRGRGLKFPVESRA